MPPDVHKGLQRRAKELGAKATVPEALVTVVRDGLAGGDPVLRAQIHLWEKQELERELLAIIRKQSNRAREDLLKLQRQGYDLRRLRLQLAKAARLLTPAQLRQLELIEGRDAP